MAVDLWGSRRISGAVKRAFAREEATLFITGHTLAPVKAVVRDIASAGALHASAGKYTSFAIADAQIN
ncbi:MAG: hypothetical protein ACHQHN_01765 [Sphingobacteriales bacterium]